MTLIFFVVSSQKLAAKKNSGLSCLVITKLVFAVLSLIFIYLHCFDIKDLNLNKQAPPLEDGLIVYLSKCLPEMKAHFVYASKSQSGQAFIFRNRTKPRTIHSKPNENCTAGTNSHTWGNISN